MSIEKNLGRIADALEALVKQGVTSFAEKAAEAGLTDAVDSAEVTNKAPAPAATNRAPAPTLPASVLLSDEDMNNELIAQFKRLGNREVIDAEMAKLGVTSVVGMTAENQNALLVAIKAFQA